VSFRRVTSCALAACALTAGIASAQAPPGPGPTPEELFAGNCGVLIPAVRRLQTAGRYLVTLRRRPGLEAAAVTLRVDDRTGHWLYPQTTAAQAIIVIPESVNPPINVIPVSIRDTSGERACEPGARPVPAAIPIMGPDQVPILEPESRTADEPATCETPFASARASSPISGPPNLPPGARVTGSARVRLDVLPDGTVGRVTVLSATNAALGEAVANSMQRMTFQPEIFRCTPLPSHTFITITTRFVPGPSGPPATAPTAAPSEPS
jgi:TonB family protein